MKYFLVILLSFYANFAFAEIYMQTDAQGNITYSDEPSKNAKQIQVIDTSNSSTSNSENASEEKTVEQVTTPTSHEKKSYTTFAIISPKDQDTLQNDPNITVNFSIVPQLQEGDKILVFLDDVPVGNPVSSSSIVLGRLERGTHRIKAVLLDSNQKILKVTPSITIYVHYAHIGNNSNSPN